MKILFYLLAFPVGCLPFIAITLVGKWLNSTKPAYRPDEYGWHFLCGTIVVAVVGLIATVGTVTGMAILHMLGAK